MPDRLVGPSRRKFLGSRLGNRVLLPTPKEAASYSCSDENLAAINAKFANVIIGSAKTVTDRLYRCLTSAVRGSRDPAG